MKNQNQKETFFEACSKLLVQNLEKFRDERKLDKHACISIYQTIFETVTILLQQTNIRLSNETANYIAQQFYDGVKINGRYELDPNIFDKRAKLENIKLTELGLLAVMFKGTDFLHPIAEALKSRN